MGKVLYLADKKKTVSEQSPNQPTAEPKVILYEKQERIHHSLKKINEIMKEMRKLEEQSK